MTTAFNYQVSQWHAQCRPMTVGYAPNKQFRTTAARKSAPTAGCLGLFELHS
jgi:hypothetical protein